MRKTKNTDEWVKEVDKKIIHWLWTIFVSVVVALVTTVVLGKILFF